MSAKTMREIVRIDEDRCDGCGLCVPNCAEGAIRVVNGKARLVADNLCDGLGNCLGTCPNDAITIEERPADEFDTQAVSVHVKAETRRHEHAHAPASGEGLSCPGSSLRKLSPRTGAQGPAQDAPSRASSLGQWPVQLALLPAGGDIWRDADVLFAADCVAFAMGDFHGRLLAGKTVAVACPKLDDVGAYIDKLTSVFSSCDVRSVTVAHMEVPCCFGMMHVVTEAMTRAGKDIPLREVTVSVKGAIIEDKPRDERSPK